MLKVADIRHTRAYEQLCLYAIACDMTPAQKGALVKKFLKYSSGHNRPESCVASSFLWSHTPEGWQYWQEINQY